MEPLTIIELQAENIKRLKAVKITPKEGVVVISGNNGEGKTSVLDSIMYALKGGSAIPEMPVRKGADKGKVRVDLGEIVVERVCTATGNNYLTVTNKEGFAAKGPQQILDKLIGMLSFDPLEFTRLKEDKQVEVLKKLTGLDFTALEAEYKSAYDERTIMNREVKNLEGHLAALPQIEAPETEVSIAELSTEYQRLIDIKNANEEQRKTLKEMSAVYKSLALQKDNIINEISALEDKIIKLKAEKEQLEKTMVQKFEEGRAFQTKVNALQDPDIEAVKKQMAEAEEINRKVRQSRQRAEVAGRIEERKHTILTLNAKMDQVERLKASQLEATKMPIPGLSFDSLGITYNGIPFSQASSAEKLKVSLAIGLALNPTIRVILIRDGSLLDNDNLKVISEMAQQYDAQIWLEKVGDGGETGVIIEDGMVKGETHE